MRSLADHEAKYRAQIAHVTAAAHTEPSDFNEPLTARTPQADRREVMRIVELSYSTKEISALPIPTSTHLGQLTKGDIVFVFDNDDGWTQATFVRVLDSYEQATLQAKSESSVWVECPDGKFTSKRKQIRALDIRIAGGKPITRSPHDGSAMDWLGEVPGATTSSPQSFFGRWQKEGPSHPRAAESETSEIITISGDWHTKIEIDTALMLLWHKGSPLHVIQKCRLVHRSANHEQYVIKILWSDDFTSYFVPASDHLVEAAPLNPEGLYRWVKLPPTTASAQAFELEQQHRSKGGNEEKQVQQVSSLPLSKAKCRTAFLNFAHTVEQEAVRHFEHFEVRDLVLDDSKFKQHAFAFLNAKKTAFLAKIETSLLGEGSEGVLDQEFRRIVSKLLRRNNRRVGYAEIGGVDLKCNLTAFAEMYERSMLLLESLTPHQSDKLRECCTEGKLLPSADIHVQAPAGAGGGKSFLGMHIAHNLLHGDSEATVLFAATNLALALFFAKWICTRAGSPEVIAKTLSRLHTLTRHSTGTLVLQKFEYDRSNASLEIVQVGKTTQYTR
jgi:hypothetical protein